MRVYEIGRAYQPADIDTGDAARRFLTWLADDAGPALARVIRTWLLLPPDAGGLGALAESEADVAALQAEIAALCRLALHSRQPGPGPQAAESPAGPNPASAPRHPGHVGDRRWPHHRIPPSGPSER